MSSYTRHDLKATYDPESTRSWANFVLYTEPGSEVVTSGLHPETRIEHSSPYVQEWAERLHRSTPNALHALLVTNLELPRLFDPCVDENTASPAAVSESGCVCRRSFTDPQFGTPVVAEHHRTVSGSTDRWAYQTLAPVSLRDGESVTTLVIDRGTFWTRTSRNVLALLPQHRANEYNVGYSGGGPRALAAYLQQLVESDGKDTAALHPGGGNPGRGLLEFTASNAAARTQELTLGQLRTIAGT
ncbi:hypothetical protein [Kitasatospora sp. MBT66]|uniref:hypothetical protein n=1 Tax=Kitasatospora sp. MBT66 TaxID=1444769 RepID=UPI0005BA2460|nr:hypothetical protein [Kitasatospora sp. MBT66]